MPTKIPVNGFGRIGKLAMMAQTAPLISQKADRVFHYHALLVNDNFSDKGTCCICINDLKPATKEQRDILFQKMHKAGYEWDAEKKELKLLITNGGDF